MSKNKVKNKSGDFFKTGKISDYLIYKAEQNAFVSEVTNGGTATAERASERDDSGTYYKGTEYR